MINNFLFIIPCFLAIAYSNTIYKKINSREIPKERATLGQANDFKIFYYILKVLMPIFLILALTPLGDSKLYFRIPTEAKTATLLLLVFAQVFFTQAVNALGAQYSPCYDSKMPKEIIAKGPYEKIRHPIYTANILSLTSIAMLSQSYVILALSVIFTYFCIRSAKQEEQALSKSLPTYKNYMNTTGMLFPKILF